MAKTVTASSETASSTPLRSKIVPRRAGSAMSSICWLTARSDSEPALTVPSQVARSGGERRAEQEEREQQADAPLDEAHGRRPRPPLAARVGGRRCVAGTG